MEGELYLPTLLKKLDPQVDPQPYVFSSAAAERALPWIPLGLFENRRD